MEKSTVKIMLMASFISLVTCNCSQDPSKWSRRKTDKWFEKEEWLKGWLVKPDKTVNRKAFAISYFRNQERWDHAFNFLKSNDFSTLELKRYDIDGDNLYAAVSEYQTKNEEDARYESHQKYIDIQYVIIGSELIGIAPASQKKDILEVYDPVKDIEFMTVMQGVKIRATPDRFFIFFPDDLHCPGMKEGENSFVRKVVVKVKVD